MTLFLLPPTIITKVCLCPFHPLKMTHTLFWSCVQQVFNNSWPFKLLYQTTSTSQQHCAYFFNSNAVQYSHSALKSLTFKFGSMSPGFILITHYQSLSSKKGRGNIQSFIQLYLRSQTYSITRFLLSKKDL